MVKRFFARARRGSGPPYEVELRRIYFGDKLETVDDARRLWDASMERLAPFCSSREPLPTLIEIVERESE